jgi:hypothetical protein
MCVAARKLTLAILLTGERKRRKHEAFLVERRSSKLKTSRVREVQGRVVWRFTGSVFVHCLRMAEAVLLSSFPVSPLHQNGTATAVHCRDPSFAHTVVLRREIHFLHQPCRIATASRTVSRFKAALTRCCRVRQTSSSSLVGFLERVLKGYRPSRRAPLPFSSLQPPLSLE